jgi:hypothetical protein
MIASRIRSRTVPQSRDVGIDRRRDPSTLLGEGGGVGRPRRGRQSPPPPPSSSLRGSSLSSSSMTMTMTMTMDPASYSFAAVASRFHRNKSTGITYLDTWMGNPNARSPPPPPPPPPTTTTTPTPTSTMEPTRTTRDDGIVVAASIATRPPTLFGRNSHVDVANDDDDDVVVDEAYAMASNLAHRLRPAAYYRMISVRPTRFDVPETLLDRLVDRVDIANETAGGEAAAAAIASTVLPLVLDLSAFRPDGSPHASSVEVGTLTKFVGGIRSYRRRRQASEDCENSTTVCNVVGVSNLPECMAEEATSMGLPIFRIEERRHRRGGTSDDGETRTIMGGKKKRGGVAPLLRQRRPGVAATTGVVVVDDTSTLTTVTSTSMDGASPHGDGASDVRIVGMGALLAPHDRESDNGAKVHRGSIRSGQLVTSDR